MSVRIRTSASLYTAPWQPAQNLIIFLTSFCIYEYPYTLSVIEISRKALFPYFEPDLIPAEWSN